MEYPFFDNQKERFGERDAQELISQVRQSNDFVCFARRYMHNEDTQVARNALWTLTKASDTELAMLKPMVGDFIDLAMQTEHSAVRRLSLNIVERMSMDKDEIRTDFLDFCLSHMIDMDEPPGVQAVCMKLAYRMCSFYPDLMGELLRTLEGIEIEYYKPAVKSLWKKIRQGKML